jgi:hypothetical protein
VLRAKTFQTRAREVTSSSSSTSNDSRTKKEETSEESEGEAEQMKKLVNMNIDLTKGKRNIIRQHQRKADVGFRINKEKQLRCVDVVFTLMTKNLNSMSEIVYNFTRECHALNNFVENISFDEKRSLTMRAYNAKKCASEMAKEIQDKRKFLNKYKKVG